MGIKFYAVKEHVATIYRPICKYHCINLYVTLLKVLVFALSHSENLTSFEVFVAFEVLRLFDNLKPCSHQARVVTLTSVLLDWSISHLVFEASVDRGVQHG